MFRFVWFDRSERPQKLYLNRRHRSTERTRGRAAPGDDGRRPESRESIHIRADVSWERLEIVRDRERQAARLDPADDRFLWIERVIVARARRHPRIAQHREVKPVGRVAVWHQIID